MRKTTNFCASFGLILSLSVLTACGNAGGSVDPLSLFNDSSIPEIQPIVQNSGALGATANAFTSASPFWTLTIQGGFIGNANYLAPARGIVTSSGFGSFNGVQGFAITIAHSGRLATRFVGITPVVRTGDSVLAGQVVGAMVGFGTNQVAFQVLLDGNPVCPLSFLSSSFRSQIGGWGLSFFCQ